MYEQEGQRLRCYVMTKYYVPIVYILHATVCILYGQLPYILKVKRGVSDLERSLFLHMATTVSIYNWHWYYLLKVASVTVKASLLANLI